MTQSQLYTALKSLGLPVAYGEFAKPTTPPFIAYQFSYSSDKMADNQNYLDISNIQIELYTKKKDLQSEAGVQALLKSVRLPYQKREVFIDSEKLWQIIYEIQLIGG